MKNFITPRLKNSKIKNLSNDEHLISLLEEMLKIKYRIYTTSRSSEMLNYQEKLINNYYKLLIHLNSYPDFKRSTSDIYYKLNNFFSETAGLDDQIFNFDISYESIQSCQDIIKPIVRGEDVFISKIIKSR